MPRRRPSPLQCFCLGRGTRRLQGAGGRWTTMRSNRRDPPQETLPILMPTTGRFTHAHHRPPRTRSRSLSARARSGVSWLVGLRGQDEKHAHSGWVVPGRHCQAQADGMRHPRGVPTVGDLPGEAQNDDIDGSEQRATVPVPLPRGLASNTSFFSFVHDGSGVLFMRPFLLK